MDPRRFFVVFALVLGVVYTMVTPPLQAPDEFNHFFRAYQISEGHWLPLKKGQRVGGELPAGVIHFSEHYMYHAFHPVYAVTAEEWWVSLKTPLQEDTRVFRDFPNTASYSALSYLPQATAICLLRPFGATPGMMYYGARWSAYLMWVLTVTLALGLLPARRWLFVLLALLPMQVFVSNSVSADTVTNCLSFLFIGLVFRLAFSSQRARKVVWVAVILLAFLLVFAKVVYCGLVGLLLLIPAERFGGRGRKLVIAGAVGVTTLLLLLWWSGVVMRFYIPSHAYDTAYRQPMGLSPCGDYEAQKSVILSQPLYFLKVVFRSLTEHPQTWMGSYIGYLGNSDVFLPTWTYFFAWVLIILTIFAERAFPWRKGTKWVMWATGGLVLILLLLSQHLLWDCPGEGVVDLVQGRYLIPIMPLFFALPGRRLWPVKFLPHVVAVGVVVLQVVSVAACGQRYLKGPTAVVQTILCDMEKTSGEGMLDQENHVLPGAAAQCEGGRGKSGKALCLGPVQPFALDMMLPALHKDDVVEAEVWQQGQGVLLVFSGGGGGSAQFYSAHALPSLEMEGWTRIRNVLVVTDDQPAGAGKFYVWYAGKGSVKVDDLRLTIRQFATESVRR